MRETDLARLRRAPAADQPHAAHGVMRRAKRALREQPGAGPDQARHAVDHRRLELFRTAEGRLDAGQALGEHRLPRARRADHEQVVPARRGHFHRAPGGQLAAHIGHVRVEHRGRDGRGAGIGIRRVAESGRPIEEQPDDIFERPDLANGHAIGGARLDAVTPWQDDRARLPAPLLSHRHRQASANRADPPIEGKLTGPDETGQTIGRRLSGGDEDADRDRKIEADPFLA